MKSVQQLLLCALVSNLLIISAFAWSDGDTVPMSYQLKVNASTSGLGEWAPIPLDFVPRFGFNRHVQLPSLDFLSSAQHVSIRFRIDRGLDKMTKWITVKRIVPMAPISDKNKKAPAESHLNRVTFKFGYQSGVFNRFTSVKVHASHSENSVPTIALEFDWDEHRRFNPHRAITVTYALSIIAVILLAHRLLTKNILPVGKSGQAKKLVVVDTRTE
eukprot:GILI01023116.1.p1 GENE.GILI01023116.1~~GILI01023116.1.p1  ORF type:complete len:216 (-),score=28.91 GILI01023116.1:67-714(-)